MYNFINTSSGTPKFPDFTPLKHIKEKVFFVIWDYFESLAIHLTHCNICHGLS